MSSLSKSSINGQCSSSFCGYVKLCHNPAYWPVMNCWVIPLVNSKKSLSGYRHGYKLAKEGQCPLINWGYHLRLVLWSTFCILASPKTYRQRVAHQFAKLVSITPIAMGVSGLYRTIVNGDSESTNISLRTPKKSHCISSIKNENIKSN